MVIRKLPADSELYHHGIKGQKWGVRRYQNYDRTLTSSGKARYSKNSRVSSGGGKGINISPRTKQILKYSLGAVAGLTLLAATAYLGYKYGGPLAKKLPSLKRKRPLTPLEKERVRRENTVKRVSTMSDEDITNGIKRLKMEQEYVDLANKSMHKSRLHINDSIDKVADATVYTILAGTTGYALRTALTGERDAELLADYVAPKPKGNQNKKKR